LKAFFSIIGLIFIIGLQCLAQNKGELEKQKNDNIEKIKYSRQLLEKTRESRNYSVNQVLIIDKGIKYRENLINGLQQEIYITEKKIESTNKAIVNNQKEQERLKSEYALLIKKSHRNIENEYSLMYILSSEDINQAYQRIKYINYLNDYRKETILNIRSLNDSLFSLNDSLTAYLEAKKTTIKNLDSEKLELKRDKKTKVQVVENLKSKEESLRKELRERELIQLRIENEIRKIIEEEARKARVANTINRLTPEQQLVSDAFGKNQGLLPWPTEQGIVTGDFGEHDHPVLKGIKVKRNGIDISTSQYSNVRAVFKGEVTKVVAIPGANYTVIITHGNFRTVYQNLINVRVKAGDKVETKEYIGKVYTNSDSLSKLHFEVWKEMNILDPALWLSK
jgi:septal ring factor EnvC (AmiA/AmiB activator)